MNEASMWATLRDKMKGYWVVSRIESSAGNGMPDVVAAIQGKIVLIELKYIKEWPKRDSTLIRLPLRPEQKLFFRTRGRLCSDIWCFCRVDDTYFMFDWERSIQLAEDGATKKEWCSNWHNLGQIIDPDELYRILQRGY